MNQRILKMTSGLAAIAVGVFAFFALQTVTHAAADFGSCKRDNDTNAVIRNGACDTNELISKYKANSKTGVPELYKAFGVPSNLGSAVKGEVHKNGDVLVGGKVVATGAVTVGRQNMSGSTKKSYGGHTFYQRKPSASFVSNSISAYVYFDANGEFQAAVLTACGNPVKATPKPKPAYACTSLKSISVDRTRFDLTVATSQHRATFKSVTFNVYKDGKKVDSQTSAGKTYRYTQNTTGSYTVKATVTFSVDGQGTKTTSESSACSTSFEVKELPKVPEYACTGLTAAKIDRTDFTFTTATSEKYATFKKVTYVITNDAGQEVQRFDANGKTSNYSRTAEGKYHVQAIVTFAVDGQGDKTVQSDNCKAAFEVEKIPEVPEYTCTSLTATPTDRTHFTFTTTTAEKYATFKKVTYVITDASGAKVSQFDATSKTSPYTNTAPGAYTVQATATFTVGGQDKTATSDSCKKPFTVTPPNMVPVCNPATGEIITVTEEEQGNYKPVGDIACQPVQVCNPGTGTVITVDKKDENKYKPVGDIACQPVEVCNPETGETITVPKSEEGNYKPVGDIACQPVEECKPGIPMNSEKCNECVPSKENNNCKEVMPAELPHTGMTNSIIALLGAGSLIASIGYFIASRRALN